MPIAEWILLLPWPEISKISKIYKVDKKLIGAIVMQESSGNTCATRYEDHYRWLYKPEMFAKQLRVTTITEEIHQKTSWGLMQVMGAVAREQGFEGEMMKLCEPEKGLTYGTKLLKKLINKYDNVEDALASYNAGSPRRNEDGTYVNQYYVDAVLTHYSKLQ